MFKNTTAIHGLNAKAEQEARKLKEDWPVLKAQHATTALAATKLVDAGRRAGRVTPCSVGWW